MCVYVCVYSILNIIIFHRNSNICITLSRMYHKEKFFGAYYYISFGTGFQHL